MRPECDGIVSRSAARERRASPKAVAAIEWLHEALADGPRPKAEVEQAAEAAGITPKSLRYARERLGVGTERRGYGAAMRAWWYLAEEGEEAVADKTDEAPTHGDPATDSPVVPNPSSCAQSQI